MIETLEQLAQYVQKSIPEPRALTGLRTQEQNGYISFQWHTTQFVVKKTLQVFELRGQSLLVTGSSILMQAAFTASQRQERILSAIVDAMRQAQTLVENGEDIAMGLKLLEGVKQSLRKLKGPEGKRSEPAPAPTAQLAVPSAACPVPA